MIKSLKIRMMLAFILDQFIKDKGHLNVTSVKTHSSIDRPKIFIFHQFMKTIKLSNVKLALLTMTQKITL